MTKNIPLINIEDEPELSYKSLYEGHKVYVRKTKGYFQRLRRYVAAPLLMIFLLTPWFRIDGRPAVFFDFAELKFYVLWSVFWPQDGIYLAALLIISAFALFAATVWAGRVWCGFTCPQTVWTLMFLWIEDKCEGNRNKRIKLDANTWTAEKVLRKSSKHIMWLSLSFVTAFAFVSYFYDVYSLVKDLLGFNLSLGAAFWLFLFTIFTYLNAGWLREQVCKHMCPYSRFQSAMYSEHSLIVSYDTSRGESRGPRKSKSNYKQQGLGDCIDCGWCVQVCPADIDIRDGLQAECINCGLCVDACDSVMDKMSYPKGLIGYVSESGLKSNLKRFFQPRMIGYSLCLVIMVSLLFSSVANRVPLQVDVVRDRGVNLFRVRDNHIENVYMVKLNNMSNAPMTVTLGVSGAEDYQLKGRKEVYLEVGEVFSVPVRLILKREGIKASTQTATIEARAEDLGYFASQAVSFLGPVDDKTK